MRERKIIGVPEVQSTRPYGLGIDVGRTFHAICLLIPSHDKINRYEWECPNLPERLTKLKRRLQTLLAEFLQQGPLSYTLESTATYHYPLMRCWGGRPCIVNPALAASFKDRKTDRIDAYKLALHHLQGLWPSSFVPTAEIEVKRLLIRSRGRLISMRARLYNTINTRLWQWNCPPVPKGSRDRVVRACIEDCARGKYQANLPMFEFAQYVPEEVWEHCVRMYSIIDEIEKQRKAVEAEIKGSSVSDLIKRLLLIPGVGPVTAHTWDSEIEPSKRFPQVECVVAYCGLDPTPKISGGKKIGMSLRRGNKFMRAALVQSATVVLGSRTALGQKFARLGGPYKRRVCVVARHLVHLMYKCSVEGMEYDDGKVIRPEE